MSTDRAPVSLPLNPCGNRTRHTASIGCCAGCHRLFSSDSAFMRHRKDAQCLDPVARGLVARDSRTAPGETVWSLPGSNWREQVTS